jgi:hypothetical protein
MVLSVVIVDMDLTDRRVVTSSARRPGKIAKNPFMVAREFGWICVLVTM